MNLKVIILAAGTGKRMISSVPKVLHPLGGIPLLEHVVRTAEQLMSDAIYIVHGNGGTMVREKLNYLPVHWIEQQEQLGTGHAVMQALPFCEDDDQVLVLYGDVPLISLYTLNHLLKDTPPNGLGLIVAELEDPTGFGRIIRNQMANITAIVEHKDADERQLQISEINTGILTIAAKHLKKWLPQLKNSNKQCEYYLTDIVALAVASGIPVGGVMADCNEEIQGVNDRAQLVNLERYYQRCLAKKLLYSGVTICDPYRIDIRGKAQIESDVVLDVNVVLEGVVKIGKNCYIGPNVVLKDVEIGENVKVFAHSMVEGAKIGDYCQIGPFARIRPGTVMDPCGKVGNFVEVKNTRFGRNSKANHLSYIGDSMVGADVNIGAGCITCNYDGHNKWQTHIGDGAAIGSNTALVAPVTIGENATIGAGSTITTDAPANQLTIARSRQESITHWKGPNGTKVNGERVGK